MLVSGLYLVVSLFLFIKELSCHGWGCGYVLIIPTFPWPFLLNPNWFSDSQVWYFVFIAVNAVILYLLIAYLSTLFNRHRNNSSKQ